MENFVLYDELGRGEQRAVYKGRRKGTVNYFAIHCVDKTKRDDLQNSVRISHNLCHKNVVQFYEWYETSNHLWLVVELCSGITLESILLQDKCLPEDIIRKFGRDVIEGLYYLHCQNIVYCDLSPSKIILDGSGILKLSNFTLAKFDGESDDFDGGNDDIDIDFGQEEGLSQRLVRGLPFYVAPEVLQGGAYTKQSDVWSLGCLLFECFTGKPPYIATQFEDLLSMITSTDVPCPIQEKGKNKVKATDELSDLFRHLLVKDSSKRMSLEDLCMHKFWDGTLSCILSRSVDDSKDDCRYFEHETQHSYVDQGGADISSEVDATVAESLERNTEPESEDACDIRNSLSNSRLQGQSSLGHGFAHLDLTSIGRISLDSSGRFNAGKETYSQSRESKQKNELYGSIEKQIVVENIQERDKPDFGVNINLIDLLYHPSDLEVNPIIENPRSNKQNAFKWDSHFIPLQTIKADRIQQMTKQDAEQHIEEIIEALTMLNHNSKPGDSASNQKSKQHLLAYLCNLSRFENLANIFLEKNVTKFLISDLKGSSTPDTKQRVGMLYQQYVRFVCLCFLSWIVWLLYYLKVK